MIQGREQFNFVMSEIAEVSGILPTIPEDSPIEKMSFESRLQKLKNEIVDVYKRAATELEALLPIASKNSAINTLLDPYLSGVRLDYEDVQEKINRVKIKIVELCNEI